MIYFERETTMQDLFFVATIIVFFALCLLYVKVCEKL